MVYAYDLGKKDEAITSSEKYLNLAPGARNAAEVRKQIQQLKVRWQTYVRPQALLEMVLPLQATIRTRKRG